MSHYHEDDTHIECKKQLQQVIVDYDREFTRLVDAVNRLITEKDKEIDIYKKKLEQYNNNNTVITKNNDTNNRVNKNIKPGRWISMNKDIKMFYIVPLSKKLKGFFPASDAFLLPFSAFLLFKNPTPPRRKKIFFLPPGGGSEGGRQKNRSRDHFLLFFLLLRFSGYGKIPLWQKTEAEKAEK